MNYTITQNSIAVVHQGQTHTVHSSAANFYALRQALIDLDWEQAQRHLTPGRSVEEWSGGKFVVVDGIIWYRDNTLPTALNDRILELARQSENPQPLFRFWAKLRKNPSHNSVTQLFGFLQHKNIPITEAGDILGYKAVDPEYRDLYTHKIDNRPGNEHEMPRNMVSDDPQHACHAGYHVGSLHYATTFGGLHTPVVVVEVDPQHVVSVPHDAEQQKMRVCKYKVIKEYDGPLPSTVYRTPPPEDDYEDDYCTDVAGTSDYDDVPF